MLSTADIASVIAAPPTGLAAGRAAYLSTKAQRSGDRSTPAQQRFADEMAAQQTAAKSTYVHPASHVTPTISKDPLSAADVAWLQRVPTDPNQVSFNDAVALASLAQRVAKGNDGDKRLVNSIWSPVKELHDAKQAKVDLANANAPLPPVPSTALQALADAVQAETPALRPHEAVARASDMLSAATQRRQAARADAIATAQAKVDAANAAKAQRLAVSA